MVMLGLDALYVRNELRASGGMGFPRAQRVADFKIGSRAIVEWPVASLQTGELKQAVV